MFMRKCVLRHSNSVSYTAHDNAIMNDMSLDYCVVFIWIAVHRNPLFSTIHGVQYVLYAVCAVHMLYISMYVCTYVHNSNSFHAIYIIFILSEILPFLNVLMCPILVLLGVLSFQLPLVIVLLSASSFSWLSSSAACLAFVPTTSWMHRWCSTPQIRGWLEI